MRVPLILFLLSIFALRILSLIPRVIDVDEAWFAASAAALKSPFEFFTTAIDNKPPGTVWFYWIVEQLFDAGTDPRPARAVSILLIAVAAWLTSLCVERRKRVLAAAVFLMATALPSPELLATSTEGLMLPFLSFVLWIGLRGLGEKLKWYHMALSGLAIAVCALMKQTTVFFVPACLFALITAARARRVRISGVSLALASAIVPVALAVWMTGWSEFWYWSYTYPAQVLTAARESLFSKSAALATNTLIFAAVLWPLIWALRKLKPRDNFRAERAYLMLWLAGAAAAVMSGSGLFYHYYLLLVPPLVVLAIQAASRLRGTRWLAVAYAAMCLMVAMPQLGTLWGSDLEYYERLGAHVDRITHPQDKVFVWAGNAMALATSGRRHATRFVTARFAAAPYSTAETEAQFKKDFLSEKPALLIDLHERGDGRFRVPVSYHDWLEKELRENYVEMHEPLLPWATFYRRQPQGAARALASEGRLQPYDFERLYQQVNSILNDPFSRPTWQTIHFTKRCLANLEQAAALEELMRAWDGLRVLAATSGQDEVIDRSYHELRTAILRGATALAHGSANETEARADRALARRNRVWLERQFQWREMPLPMSLASRSWWMSFAMVKLQPVAKTDNLVQRTF